jgi:hypothetical protein
VNSHAKSLLRRALFFCIDEVPKGENMDFNVNGTTALPFIALVGGKKDFWHTMPTGDWLLDCQTGKEFGEMLHRFAFFNNMPTLLSTVARAITEKGFFHTIGASMCASGLESGLDVPSDLASSNE